MLDTSLRGFFRVLSIVTIALTAMEGGAAQAETTPASTPPAPNPPQAAAPVAPHRTFAPAEQAPFAEDTTLLGKPPAGLKGVWFVVVDVPLAPGYFKAFPQILQITDEKSGPVIHLLDLKLPDDIQRTIKAPDTQRTPWQPDAATVKALAQTWSTLPPAKLKGIDEPLYGKNHFKIVAPDKYPEAFPKRDDATERMLKDSNFAITAQEEYRPRDLGPNSRIAQMIMRTTFYGVKSVDKNTLKGEALIAFVAAGSGAPLPYTFSGPFVMYRLS